MNKIIEKNKLQAKRPAGVIVLSIYIVLQGISLFGLTGRFGSIVSVISILVIVMGVGLFRGSLVAYVGTLIIFASTIITAAVHYLSYGEYYFSLGSIIGLVFWSALILIYLSLPGVRNYFLIQNKNGAVKKTTASKVILPPSPNKQSHRNESVNNELMGDIDQPVFTWPTGAKYFGDHKAGKRHGWGETHYPNGTKYAGYYYNDKRHGSGTMVYPDGRKQEGVWDMDNLN